MIVIPMKNLALHLLVGSIGFLTSSAVSWGAVIAYDNSAQTGNQPTSQPFTGALGMDFNVNAPIIITALGVFDSGGGALKSASDRHPI